MMVMSATPSAPTSMTALPFAWLPILCCKAMIFFHSVCVTLSIFVMVCVFNWAKKY